MNDSALDILAGTFKKQETLTDTNTYTFESKITVLDKNIGAGCPVHVFEKATGNLVYTTETDSESFIYVPNLLKNIKYFVVATDKSDTYNSIIFDLNWDFAQQSGSKYNLKYYSKYQAKNSKDIYTYTDTVSDLVYDPNLLYSISVPLQKEDQKATWFGAGVFNFENVDGFPSFSFKGSASTYTYINFTPVQTGDSFTIECYIRPLALFSGKTVAGGVFSQNTSQGLFISDDFRLSYKNKNLTINTISTLDADTWYHVAVSYDSRRIRLFLNGKKEAEIEDSIGLEYLSSVFCVGAGFYGYLSGFKIFQESKYEDDFTPNFRPFGHLPVIYSNEEDPYANNTVLKSYISDSGYLKDKAKNIPLSFDYTIPKDSYIISNNSFIRTPTRYADLALNGDFTIEVKFRLLYRTGTNPVIFGNKSNKTEWVTNNWHLHADHPNRLEKYGLSIYGGNSNNFLANYPTIYNEPVSLVLQRKGTTYSYYFNGFSDRSFIYATAMDTRTSSYFSIGGDISFELYDIKVTKGVARYSENYKDEQLQGSEALLKAYYQIVNYPFKESLFDARNALAFINTGVLLTSNRSSYNTKSALFANSYFVTSKSYWYTPNESFTVEFKISCNILPLTTDGIINTATLFSIFTDTSDNFKLAIRDKYLSFYNGFEWLDSEFELDDEETFKHIVLQRNSTSIKILAEGSLVLETTCPDLAGRRNVSIGANKSGSDTFNGYMNNLFIYKNYCKYEDNYEVPQDPDEYVPTDEEKEPDVLITPYTTSALNFENGMIDQIGTTIWQKEGTANITYTNKIFGDNSFETKAIGDSLYTNSNIITGGSTPFTIEFYINLKTYGTLFCANKNSASGAQSLSITPSGNLTFSRNDDFINPIEYGVYIGKNKIKLNETTKITIAYDSSVLLFFVNDALDLKIGNPIGIDVSNILRFMFLSYRVDMYQTKPIETSIGLIDNINIHDGIATKIRDYDPYEEYLVVDLPFDGENNSTKIVDNTAWELAPITPLFYPFTDSFYNGTVYGTIQLLDNSSPFNDKSAYFNNSYILHNSSSAFNLTNKDFTIKCWVKFDSNRGNANQYPSIIAKRASGTQWDGGLECNTTNGIISFVYNNSQYVTIKSGLEFDTWMHVCVTCKNNKLYLFFNGELINSVNLTSPISFSNASVLVGRTSTSWSDNYLKGNLSDLVFINGYCEHTETFTLPTEHLKKYNKWTVNGNAKISTDQKFDGFSSLYLPDFSSNISSNIAVNFSKDWTVSFLFKSNIEPDSGIFTPFFKNITDDFSFGVDNNGATHKFALQKNVAKYYFEYTGKWFSNNSVIHKIDLIKTGDKYFLYLDGILKDTRIFNIDSSFSDNSTLIFGPVTNNGRSFIGYYKNFKIYKDIAVIPEDPTGKIQLDFDNNVIDRYGNSTWTNNGVTFDQVNSVKGHAAYFNNGTKISTGLNQNLNFDLSNHLVNFDCKMTTINTWNDFLYGGVAGSASGIFYSSGRYLRHRFDGSNYYDTNITILANNYYNYSLLRKNHTFINKVNDVVVSCYNSPMIMDYNRSNQTFIGANSLGGEYITGYIDNFKSVKDYKEQVVIDKPAVHLPLETNATNIGFTQLTVNSVGSLSYTTIDGKKCIKFESGKYLTIDSNNIFNLGENSDFYIEFDFYWNQKLAENNYPFFLSDGSNSTGYTRIRLNSSNKIGLVIDNYSPSHYIEYPLQFHTFYKYKIFRKGNSLSSYLYDNTGNLLASNENDSNIRNINFSMSTPHIGGGTYFSNISFDGYMSNFKMFVGTSQPPETYNDKKVLDLDFKPTGKSYLFKDNNNKCIIHPVNIIQRDYQDSTYCCYFNGTNQYLQLGKNDLFNIGNDDFVLSVKFKFQKRGQNLPLLTGGVTTNTDGYWYVQVRSENSATNPLKVEFVYRIDASNVYTIYCNQTLIENEIYEFTVVREGSTVVAYLNDVPDFTITDNRQPPPFNLNGNGNTYIGVNQFNSLDWIYKGYIYHVKFARNTSDTDILKPPKKQTEVELEKTDGIWVQSVSVVGSPESWIKYDPQGTQTEEWQTFFANTLNFGILQYKNQSAPTTTLTQTGSAIIDKSPLNKVFKIIAGNGTWHSTSIGCNLEFLDPNDNVVAALKWYQDGTFRHAISYGPNLGSQTRVGVVGSYPQTNGELSITPSGFVYTNKATTNYNESFSYNQDLSSVTKVRVSGLTSTYDYSGAGAAYFIFQQLSS